MTSKRNLIIFINFLLATRQFAHSIKSVFMGKCLFMELSFANTVVILE